jgi:hypothetical protein
LPLGEKAPRRGQNAFWREVGRVAPVYQKLEEFLQSPFLEWALVVVYLWSIVFMLIVFLTGGTYGW